MDIVADAGSLTLSGRVCGLPVGNLPPEDFKRVYYYSIFPNLLLSMHPDYVMYHLLWPEGPNRTRITCDWLFHPDSFHQPGFDAEDAIHFWDMTNRQDWAICEQSQTGIQSCVYQPGPYSAREGLLAAWDRAYLQALAAKPDLPV
jgi:Rieske 2Fe-2S family protein